MEPIQINRHEARVLGVLIEKELTTPDQYPLSLNALGNGCNQKSNRDPVEDFLEAEILVALQGLTMKGLAGRVTGAGSRVEKYRHNARETLRLDVPETAVLAELLMRGPQTQGELRARVNRMSKLADLDELRGLLESLQAKGYAAAIGPGHGSRAGRFAQRLSPGLHGELGAGGGAAEAESAAAERGATRLSGAPGASGVSGVSVAAAPGPGSGGLPARVEALAAAVADLRAKLERLARDLGAEVD